jgi:PRTRC genetic system protein E
MALFNGSRFAFGDKSMFKELLPLLRQRAVLMTVCVVEDGSLRVNIMPKKTGTEDAAKSGADSNTALTTPLSVTGTAEELDRDLPQAIVEFVGSHLTLKQSLEATQAEMDAADKLAKAEAKNKFQTGKKPTPATTAAKTSEKPEPPKPPAPPSLFDFPETAPATPAVEAKAATTPEPPAMRTATAVAPAPSATTVESATDEEDELWNECSGNDTEESAAA